MFKFGNKPVNTSGEIVNGTIFTMEYFAPKSGSWEFYRDVNNPPSSELRARVEGERLPIRKVYPNGSYYPAGNIVDTVYRCVELGIPRSEVSHQADIDMKTYQAIKDNPEMVKAMLAE